MNVYLITNTVNGHRYVGSETISGSRKRTHLFHLRRGTHHSRYLQRAFDRHGEQAFSFSVLETDIEDSTLLLAREQHYLDTLGPEYNICRIAGSNKGATQTEATKAKIRAGLARARAEGRWTPNLIGMTGKTHPPSVRAAISASNKGRTTSAAAREKIRSARLGHKASPEAVEANRRSHLGLRPSEETRAKLRAAQRSRPPLPPPSAETRARMSDRQRERWAKMPSSVRKALGEKLSAALTGRPISSAARAAISKANKGRKIDPAARAVYREAQKKRWASTPDAERRAFGQRVSDGLRAAALAKQGAA